MSMAAMFCLMAGVLQLRYIPAMCTESSHSD